MQVSRILMESEYAEDKLGSTLIIQNCLIPKGDITWREDLPIFASFFDDGLIWDWASCDSFCSRVLKNLVKSQKIRGEREGCARQIAVWRDANNLPNRETCFSPGSRACCYKFVRQQFANRIGLFRQERGGCFGKWVRRTWPQCCLFVSRTYVASGQRGFGTRWKKYLEQSETR